MEELINKIHNAECLKFMKQLPDKCVDCICVDPPYFEIVENDWDNQWKDIFDFQKWVGEVGKEFNRILKDNGSFYWFGDDKTIAYCQVELDKHFRLLNSLVWRKTNAMCIKGVSEYRSYAPITERCLFYDKGESLTGLEMVKQVMPNPFAEYLKSEIERSGKSRKEISSLFPSRSGGLTGCVSNWINGENIITLEQFNKIKNFLGKDFLTREYEELRLEYEELRLEYEELRLEYEELRRVWNNDKNALDVLEFPIYTGKDRFHETQKPVNLISYLLQRSTRKGDVVFDCFSGSGTTAIASHDLGLNFIAVEKEDEYWEKSVKRLEKHQRQLSLF